MNLNDLRVQYRCDGCEAAAPYEEPGHTRPASLADLVSVLVNEGAMVHSSNNAIEIGWFNGEQRSYLVFRIPDEKEEK